MEKHEMIEHLARGGVMANAYHWLPEGHGFALRKSSRREFVSDVLLHDPKHVFFKVVGDIVHWFILHY